MFPEVFGAWHTDDTIRKQSSSGGVFSAVAETVLGAGGVVFGAAMDHSNHGLVCRHIKCDSPDFLSQLRGSKYTVSALGDVFPQVQTELSMGKNVLFSGTPCQTAALEAYLGGRPQNLILVDVICHGVPVPYLLEKFLGEQEKRMKKRIVNISFRDKTDSWENYAVKTVAEDHSVNRDNLDQSEYMQMFLSDRYLRPSCYNCQFKGEHHRSDLTLGDFWNIQSYLDISGENIEKGVSVVVVYTNAGRRLLEDSSDKLMLVPASMEYFCRSNLPYKQSVRKPFGNGVFLWMLKRFPSGHILHINKKLQKVQQLSNAISRHLSLHPGSEIKTGRLLEKKNCYGCCNCERICSAGAIEMQRDELGTVWPVVDNEKCISCGKCLHVCPGLVEKKRCAGNPAGNSYVEVKNE